VSLQGQGTLEEKRRRSHESTGSYFKTFWKGVLREKTGLIIKSSRTGNTLSHRCSQGGPPGGVRKKANETYDLERAFGGKPRVGQDSERNLTLPPKNPTERRRVGREVGV